VDFKEEAEQLLQEIIAQDLASDRVEAIRRALSKVYHQGKTQGIQEALP
jgi:hypothetical protein